MLGNLFRECGVVNQLAETASNALMYIGVILLGHIRGRDHQRGSVFECHHLKDCGSRSGRILLGTIGGVLLGKLLCVITHGKINPLIGSAGVSAVPMRPVCPRRWAPSMIPQTSC